MSQTSSCRAELGTAQLSAGNLSYWCWRLLCPFQDLRAHPGTLNDELGFAFMASLYARFVLLLLWCHSTCQLTLLSLAFRRSTVLRAQAFQQDHGETQAAIARFVPPAAGDRWRAPDLGDGLFDL